MKYNILLMLTFQKFPALPKMDFHKYIRTRKNPFKV